MARFTHSAARSSKFRPQFEVLEELVLLSPLAGTPPLDTSPVHHAKAHTSHSSHTTHHNHTTHHSHTKKPAHHTAKKPVHHASKPTTPSLPSTPSSSSSTSAQSAVQAPATTSNVTPPPQGSIVGIDFFSALQQHIDPSWGLPNRQPDPAVYPSPGGFATPDTSQPFPDTQWQGDSRLGQVSVNAPVVQPVFNWYYQNVHANVLLSLPGVPNGTPYVLSGSSGVQAFTFNQPGQVATNPTTGVGTVANVTGQAPLPQQIYSSSVTITWKLTLNPGTPQAQVIPLGSTTPTFDLIYGEPQNATNASQYPSNLLTDQRLARAIAYASPAITAAGANATTFTIAQQLMNTVSDDIGFSPQNTASPYFWLAPGQGEGPFADPGTTQPVDCISLATFSSWVAQAVGLPGTYQVKTFVPDVFEGTNSNPFSVVWGALKNVSASNIPSGANAAYFKEVDYNNDPSKRLFLIDFNNFGNVFEATLAVTDNNNQNMYFVPGQHNASVTDSTLNTLIKTLFQGVGYYDASGNPVYVYPFSSKVSSGVTGG
jgi:hypothetical protein